MTHLDHTRRLQYLDQLIRQRATGSSRALARRLKVCRSTVMNDLDQLRQLGGDVDYCRLRRSYYYRDDRQLFINFMKKSVVRLGGLATLVAFSIFTQPATAQVYLGSGYCEAIIGENYDIVSGVAITLQREVKLGSSRWRLNPMLHTGLLFNESKYPSRQGNTTTLSLSGPVSYDLVRFKKVTLTPYAGPFISWLASYREDLFFLEPQRVDRLFGGGEAGLMVKFTFTDQFAIKLIPISAQFGNDFYRQAMFTLSFQL